MGEMNNAIVCYLSDKARFADLINAEIYGGRQVIKPDGLTEISSTTYRKKARAESDDPPKRKENRGDIVMKYEDGRIYRLILMEAQDKVSYVFPLRSIEYLLAQYMKQMSEITAGHKKKEDYGSIDEKFSGINREDRLKPEYIIWLYHGEKPWDGPRTLKDMMDFGDDSDGFSSLFQDFNPHLVCVNELKTTEKYTTELRELLDLLIARPDRHTIKRLILEDDRFDRLDEDTYETASILLKAPAIWKNRKSYLSDDEGRSYNMCKALEDWEAEIRAESAEEIQRMETQIEQKDAQIEQKDAQIVKLQNEIASLQAQLAAGMN